MDTTGTAAAGRTDVQARGSTTRVGRRGEALATEHLVELGWQIVERNWHCRFAEVDIIAFDPGGELVFVEVKYRKNTAHGSGVEAVTPAKLRRMRLAAGKWLAERDRGVAVVRFDVIDVGPAGVREHVVGVG